MNSKECEIWENNIRIKKNTKNISYPEARKLVRNSVVTTTYTNVTKPVNNSTQNQGMTHNEMINLIKELKTLIELLRESVTNLITKTHAEPKKNIQPQTNKAEDPPKKNNKKKKPSIHTITTKPNNPPPKKLNNNESPLLTSKERSSWKKESNKHKSRISFVETENKLMETELRKLLNTGKS